MKVLGKILFGFSPFGSAAVSGKPPVEFLPSGLAVVVSGKTTDCVPAIWFGGGCWKKLDVALTSSTIGSVVLFGITISRGACIGVLCVDTTAEEVCPLSTSCCSPDIGAEIIVEPAACDVSPTIILGLGWWFVAATS